MGSKSFYILSFPERQKKNMYKIGYHRGSEKDLITRYITPLLDPQIHFFITVNNAKEIESCVKRELDTYRMVNCRGNKSEWIQLDLTLIIKCALKHMLANKSDLYQILGVSSTASPSEIKHAYNKLALRYHPDKNKESDATVKMQMINHAYHILSDPEKRKQYDAQANICNNTPKTHATYTKPNNANHDTKPNNANHDTKPNNPNHDTKPNNPNHDTKPNNANHDIFVCQYCGNYYIVGNVHKCIRVYSTYTEPNNDRFECQYCGKDYSTTSNLYRHQRESCTGYHSTYTKPNNAKHDRFECQYCGKDYSTSSNLYRHQRESCTGIHQTYTKSNSDRLVCQYCGKDYSTTSNLYRHQRESCIGVKRKRQRFVCSYCGLDYSTQGNLNRHQRESCR